MAGHLLGILLEVVNRISENINEELPFDQTSDSSSKGIIGEIYLDSRPESSTLKIRRENRNQKEPLSKQQGIEKKTHRSRSQGSSSLPTNWDRYEEEEELDSLESASKIVDVEMPKSKGADFRHLVAEAQSHAEKTLEAFISLDELLPWEFGVVLGSMLAVRGESVLSWIADDNFVIEDKTSANQEASFISLNLNSVVESLAKVGLSKRLFIESDLLPTELELLSCLSICYPQELILI